MATSAASFGGTDPRAIARMVVGEIPELPVVPALPDRGVGADAVGRTCALLVDLPVDLSPRAWRLADSPGRAGRRAADFLDRDLDALEQQVELARGAVVDGGSAFPATAIRFETVGPWSLAARVELPGGRPVLSDSGARRDLAESLREGLSALCSRARARFSVPVRLVLDEPELWRIAAGSVPAPSEFDPVAAVPRERLAMALSRFAAALRSSDDVDSVFVRAPGRNSSDAPTAWPVLLEPPQGEARVDGIVFDAADLLAWADAGASAQGRGSDRTRPVHGWADGDRDPQAFALLDALGALLSDGGRAELHRTQVLAGRETPRTNGEAEAVAARIVSLIDRLAVDRPMAVDNIALAAGERDTASSTAAAAALAGARRTADVLPRVAAG